MPVIALLDTRESERHETAEALRAEGYDVEEFRDSGDLFDAMVGDAPDLLITNVDDPAIDGTALTVKLRHRFSRLDLPILLESASENEDAIIRCIEAGASDYLVRPYQAHRLLAKVHILLKERERRVRDEPLDDDSLEDTVQVGRKPKLRRTTARIAPPMPRRRFQRYLITGELGRGGMGIVYKARHLDSGVYVALKLLGARAVEDRKFLARFFREIQLLRALDNPHVVRVVDSGLEDDAYFLAMELIEGRSTKELLKEEGPRPAEELEEIARAMLEALRSLHELGLVHRDIKPANILIAIDGTIKLVDFGLAKREGEKGLTMSGEAIGTPYYLSPESIRGRQADIRSDLYSLGITLFELAAGRKPFTGKSAIEVFQSVFYDELPRLRDDRPDLSTGFCDFVAALMARDPEHRPLSPTAALALLQQLCSGTGSSEPASPEAVSPEPASPEATSAPSPDDEVARKPATDDATSSSETPGASVEPLGESCRESSGESSGG